MTGNNLNTLTDTAATLPSTQVHAVAQNNLDRLAMTKVDPICQGDASRQS